MGISNMPGDVHREAVWTKQFPYQIKPICNPPVPLCTL